MTLKKAEEVLLLMALDNVDPGTIRAFERAITEAPDIIEALEYSTVRGRGGFTYLFWNRYETYDLYKRWCDLFPRKMKKSKEVE